MAASAGAVAVGRLRRADAGMFLGAAWVLGDAPCPDAAVVSVSQAAIRGLSGGGDMCAWKLVDIPRNYSICNLHAVAL